jgi:hypothetical protein
VGASWWWLVGRPSKFLIPCACVLCLRSPTQPRPRPPPERTGPSPWHAQSGLEASCAGGRLSPCLAPRHRRGPPPTDDTHLPPTVWAGQRRSGIVAGGRPRGRCPGGRRDPAPDGIRCDGPAGAQHAAVAPLHAARGQDVLQAPASPRQDVAGGRARACAAGLTGGEGDEAVRARDETAVGASHWQDGGGKRRHSGSAMGLGRAVHVPGRLPARWIELRQEVGRGAHCCGDDGAGERREGADGHGEGGAGGEPGVAGRGEATARDESGPVGMRRELPAPGGPDTCQPGQGSAEEAGSGGETLQRLGRGVEQGRRGGSGRGTTAGAARRRHGEGEQAGRPWQRCLPWCVEPRLRLRGLTRGAMALAAGGQEAVTPAAALARSEAVASVSGAAGEASMEGVVVRRGQGGMPRDRRRRRGGDAGRDGGHGGRPRITLWRRAEASSWPCGVRGRETMVVASRACPRERWSRRGLPPAARRGGASAGLRGGMATARVVRLARWVACRQAPWTLRRFMGAVAGDRCL